MNWVVSLLVPFSVIGVSTISAAPPKGEVEFKIVDEQQQPLAARIQILNAKGKTVRAPDGYRHADYHVISKGSLKLALGEGTYTFTLSHGPHHKERSGHFVMDREVFDVKTLVLPRFSDPHKSGWYSGDLLVDHEYRRLQLLRHAEDLDVIVAPSWRASTKSTWKEVRGRHEKESNDLGVTEQGSAWISNGGGDLLLVGFPKGTDPIDWPTDSTSLVTQFRQLARHDTVPQHVTLLEPDGDDLPLLVALQQLDSISLLGPRLRRKIDQAPTGRSMRDPQDSRTGQGGRNWGLAGLELYYQLLNTGVHIPPVAASGSGVNDNPAGMNRVYVACGQDFTATNWWDQLKRGRVVISNGPLLTIRVNDELPGHTFQIDAGNSVDLDIACQLATQQKLEYLEIIQNGKIIHTIRLDEWGARGGVLPIVTFSESGWLAVRVVGSNPDHFLCAMSGPYYVEVNAEPRISRTACQFFLDWLTRRAREVRAELPADQLETTLTPFRQARDFWNAKLQQANAD